jgi:hypothetical protein
MPEVNWDEIDKEIKPRNWLKLEVGKTYVLVFDGMGHVQEGKYGKSVPLETSDEKDGTKFKSSITYSAFLILKELKPHVGDVLSILKKITATVDEEGNETERTVWDIKITKHAPETEEINIDDIPF